MKVKVCKVIFYKNNDLEFATVTSLLFTERGLLTEDKVHVMETPAIDSTGSRNITMSIPSIVSL